jgi:hypothetical protein
VRVLLATLLSAALTAVAPAAAGAVTFCVNDPGCVSGGGTASANLGSAVSAAAIAGGRDRIQIGPNPTPYTGANAYVVVAPGNAVDIVGAGQAATVIQGSALAQYILNVQDPSSTVSDLTLLTPGGDPAALTLALAGTAERVTLDAIVHTFDPAVAMAPGAVLRAATADAPGFGSGVTTQPGSGPPAIVEDSSFVAQTGVDADSGTLDIRRSRLLTEQAGVLVSGGATVTISSSLLQLDSAIFGALGARGNVAGDGTINARHLTLIGPGTPGSIGLQAQANISTSVENIALAVSDSIITGFEKAVVRTPDDFSANIALDWSVYDGSIEDGNSGTGTGTLNLGPNNLPAGTDPLFVNRSAGDLHLQPASPLIDRGNPAGLGAADSPTDLDGAVRVSDGNADGVARSDLGAFELPGAAIPDTSAPLISRASMLRTRFAVGRAATPVSAQRRRRVKRGTAFRYTLSETSDVTIAIQRRTIGRRVGGRCRKATRRNRSRRRCTRFVRAGALRRADQSGSVSTSFSGRIGRRALKPSRYRATITATDTAGNRSAPRRLAFRVVRLRR